MHQDQDFELEGEPLPNEDTLIQDLELTTLFSAMADGNVFLLAVARRAVLSGLTDPVAIRYRQQMLADCLRQTAVVREIYDIAVEAEEGQKGMYFGMFRDSPGATLSGSIRVLETLVPLLRRLRGITDKHGAAFVSDGFVRFFAMISEELSDGYLDTVEGHLRHLDPRRGVLLNALLGKVNGSVYYLVRRPRRPGWRGWIPSWNRSAFSFQIPPRDTGGFKALADMRSRGINRVANALAQSADHIRSFFRMLRTELAFYIGCLNLHERLETKGEPTCFPVPSAPGTAVFSVAGLYDVCLTLILEETVVGNDVRADGRSLVVITGANQGGKSTFLRSVGLAQLMMQTGMFVPAQSFRANVSRGVFTHHKREEDPTMEKGKLEEELSRMSEIADAIGPNCLLLCNESFASTNEREGSEIARQIVRAMTEVGVKVFYVTHLYDLAHRLHAYGGDSALFLRAERRPDGQRTFKLVEGGPLPTSFGEDLYRRIFGPADDLASTPVDERTP